MSVSPRPWKVNPEWMKMKKEYPGDHRQDPPAILCAQGDPVLEPSEWLNLSVEDAEHIVACVNREAERPAPTKRFNQIRRLTLIDAILGIGIPAAPDYRKMLVDQGRIRRNNDEELLRNEPEVWEWDMNWLRAAEVQVLDLLYSQLHLLREEVEKS